MKGKIILSAVTGLFFAIIAYFLLIYMEISDALVLAVFCGALFTLILNTFLLFYGRFLDKKYSEFEKAITSPLFYKTNGNFNLGNGKLKNGNIYFCETGIVCVSLDEKPYCYEEIFLQNIEHYEFDEIHLNIFTNDGRAFVITTPDAKKVIEILKDKEWI